MRFLNPALFLAGCIAALPGPAAAHDIPADVTVQVYLKPAGSRLQVLVRVPLKTIRDLDFPERAGGYLDVEKLAPMLPDVAKVWIADPVEIQEGGSPLPKAHVAATQISLASDRSFVSFEEALAHITGPRLANSENVVWNQVLLDVLLEYPIHSDRSLYSIRPGLERLAERVVTVLRFLPPGGAVRAFEFLGDAGLVQLDPRWHQAARRFLTLGFFHILDGTDHLLFLFCLVIPLRRLRPLVLVVTAFTLAHSITLIGSAYGLAPGALWFPPLIETLIAISILYMALENIVRAGQPHGRWMIAFGFGLVHGFGFSFALQETLQFAGSHLAASLLAFNVGVELGQLLVLAVFIPMLAALFRFGVAERMGTVILSALAAHTAWHWMLERAANLNRYQWSGAVAGAAQWAEVARWMLVGVIAAGAVYSGLRLLRMRAEVHSDRKDG